MDLFLVLCSVGTVFIFIALWFMYWTGELGTKSPSFTVTLLVLNLFFWIVGIAYMDLSSITSKYILFFGLLLAGPIGWYVARWRLWFRRRTFIREIRSGQ